MQEFTALLNEYSPPNEPKSTMIDSGTTCHLNKDSDGLLITGDSSKIIVTATGETSRTSGTATLPMTQLPAAARVMHILPNLQVSLMSVSVLANNGFITIFHPYQNGVSVHGPDGVQITVTKEALLQGWRDHRVTDVASHTTALDRPAPSIAVNNIYELPSTERVIRFLHGALGFPTRAMLLAAARNGNLSTFPGLTPESI
jgi:hypothetical protein